MSNRPAPCERCGVKRRAERGGRWCFDCVPGGPIVPPPCARCGSAEDFFASGLCRRCHIAGAPAVDSCRDCFAWGVTRTNKWLCRGCINWRRLHRPGTCASCGRDIDVNQRQVCRLCWKNASGARYSTGGFDPIGPNRQGQQLFIANMQKAARLRQNIDRPACEAAWPAGRPVAHRQLILFEMPRDLSRGRLGLPAPRDAELAAALDAIAVNYARRNRWARTPTAKVRAGIRVLLGLQDTPGAPIRHSETVVLARLFITIRPVVEVLDSVAMFEDDRTPALARWFAARTEALPEPMAGELRLWFDVMHNGSTTQPRRKPRAPTTIKNYVTGMLHALTTWVAAGHLSLREISRDDVLAVLPGSGPERSMTGQALRSLFTILKARKLVFANPIARIRIWSANQPQPVPIETLDGVRDALDSVIPGRALLAALAAFHGLRAGELRDLKLVDLRDRHLHITGGVDRVIPLAEPVQERLRGWLDHRSRCWPDTTNPHLFIHFRTAARTDAVGPRWIRLTLDLPGTVQTLRRDRILHEAVATGGDTRRLCDLFGISITTASRYTDTVREPIDPTSHRATSADAPR